MYYLVGILLTRRAYSSSRYELPHRGSLYVLSLCIFSLLGASSWAVPLPQQDSQDRQSIIDSTLSTTLIPGGNLTNSTASDLYVIRAVVYEIGILTDADNSTNDTTEKHEEVNISFFNPPHQDNGLLDLSDIPVPQIISVNPNDHEESEKSEGTSQESSSEGSSD